VEGDVEVGELCLWVLTFYSLPFINLRRGLLPDGEENRGGRGRVKAGYSGVKRDCFIVHIKRTEGGSEPRGSEVEVLESTSILQAVAIFSREG